MIVKFLEDYHVSNTERYNLGDQTHMGKSQALRLKSHGIVKIVKGDKAVVPDHGVAERKQKFNRLFVAGKTKVLLDFGNGPNFFLVENVSEDRYTISVENRDGEISREQVIQFTNRQ